MIDLINWLIALAAILLFAFGGWLASLTRNDVSIVDSLWALFFLLAASAYVVLAPTTGPRAILLLVLVGIWALRLSGYLTWRNWGEPEDRRYQEIRTRNQPGFTWKSLYLVFALQGVLAWVIAAPLAAGISGSAPLNTLDGIGLSLWLFGFGFEAVGDWQLARFKSDPANRGQVMDHGLWRYTRHPNYFGEACLWWGYYLIALAAGGWWTLFAPLLMSVLLIRVSGVALLEKDMSERRPAYRNYVARTNAFLPGPRRQPGARTGTVS